MVFRPAAITAGVRGTTSILTAFELIRCGNKNVVAVSAGPGVDQISPSLNGSAEAVGLEERLTLMGTQGAVIK